LAFRVCQPHPSTGSRLHCTGTSVHRRPVAFEANLMRLNATTRANNSIRRGVAAKAGVAEAAWAAGNGGAISPERMFTQKRGSDGRSLKTLLLKFLKSLFGFFMYNKPLFIVMVTLTLYHHKFNLHNLFDLFG